MCLLAIILGAALSALAAHAAAIRNEGIIATAPTDAYAGAASCAQCHSAQYVHWSNTLKAHSVRPRRDMEEVPGTWANSPVKSGKDDVLLVVGRNRKAAFAGKNWRVLGAEYRFTEGTRKAFSKREERSPSRPETTPPDNPPGTMTQERPCAKRTLPTPRRLRNRK